MAKGKKTTIEDIYKVMIGYASNKNIDDLSRLLDMPASTVRKIVKDNKEKPEFKELCSKKADEFADKATKIIDKAIIRLEKELDDKKREIPINHLTTVIGTMYDKRALAKGENTSNQSISIKMTPDVKELSK